MEKEVVAEFTYELPLPMDEEIQKEIDAMGLTGNIKPEDVRNYIRENIYNLYCEAMTANKEVIEWQDFHMKN